MIKWEIGKEDERIIRDIAKRAVGIAAELGVDYDYLTVQMDVTATHLSGCPLDLERLLNADRTNFAHDIFGIRRNLDRSKGKLLNCFDPRYSAKELVI